MSDKPLDSSHQDYETLAPLVDTILRCGKGFEKFSDHIPRLIRQICDEVIDAPRTNRFLITELEKTEKTYIGTKVEILVRRYLGLPKGQILDLSIGGVEADIKMTTARAWMIPRECVGHPALLFRASEKRARCDVGIIVCHQEYLSQGQNQDRKRTIRAAHFQDIWWILNDRPYPENFWQILPADERIAIMKGRSGKKRLAALFEKVRERPITRFQVESVAQQQDPLKRIRVNGGARDILAPKGIELLSGAYHQARICELGLAPIRKDEFISIKTN